MLLHLVLLNFLFSNQINFSGTYKSGKIKHQLFTGLDFDNSIADVYTFVFNPFFYDTINIYNLNLYPQNSFIPEAKNTKIVKTTTNNFGIYFQDLISIKEKIKIFKLLYRLSYRFLNASIIIDARSL